MIGPIESKFDQVAHLPVKAPKKLGDVLLTATYLEMHFGVSETVRGKLLPAFGVVRGVIERSEAGEKVQLVELNKALSEGNHVDNKRWWQREMQRDLLVRAYQLDRMAIDRVLDFQQESKQNNG